MTTNLPKYTLSSIKNITSIVQLSKFDVIIRKYCKHITKCNTSDDIVNDMYIKLDSMFKKRPDLVIDGGYVSIMLRNLFNDMYKRNKVYDYGNVNNNPVENISIIDDYEETRQQKINDDKNYDALYDYIQTLPYIEQRLIELKTIEGITLTKISKKTGINYNSLTYNYKKVLDKLKALNNPNK